MRRTLLTLAAAMTLLIAAAIPAHAQATTVWDLLKHQYGITGNPAFAEAEVLVNNSCSKVRPYDPGRIQIVINNNSWGPCYVAHSAGACSSNALSLSAQGGFIEQDFLTDTVEVTTEYWMYCSVPGSTIHYSEVMLNQ